MHNLTTESNEGAIREKGGTERDLVQFKISSGGSGGSVSPEPEDSKISWRLFLSKATPSVSENSD